MRYHCATWRTSKIWMRYHCTTWKTNKIWMRYHCTTWKTSKIWTGAEQLQSECSTGCNRYAEGWVPHQPLQSGYPTGTLFDANYAPVFFQYRKSSSAVTLPVVTQSQNWSCYNSASSAIVTIHDLPAGQLTHSVRHGPLLQSNLRFCPPALRHQRNP